MFLTEYFILTVTFLLLLATIYIKYAFNYWKRRKVPYLEPSLPFGNLKRLIGGQSVGLLSTDFYEDFKKRNCNFGGVYALFNPLLVVCDPEIIKTILSKDYQHFINRGVYYNEKYDPLAADLFNIGGQRWKNLRTKLSPNYTSGKMKLIFGAIGEACRRLEKVLETNIELNESLDVKELSCCYTTDINTICSFGLECNSLENPDVEFRRYGKKFFEKDGLKEIKHFLSVAMPEFSRNIGIVTRKKDVTKFFRDLFLDTIKYRRQNNCTRKDLLQLLISIHDSKENNFTIDEVTAHCLNFFLASFETSSATMEFCLYEMAVNHDIQRKVREEIKRVLNKFGGQLSYEAIAEMKYLGQIVDETLRKYPPVPTLNRECTMDYKIPGTNVIVEKGTGILIPAYGLHNDPDYFPEPEKFDPERFSEENRGNIPSHVYLPFGEGPRNCIGMRFGLLQVKVGLATILNKFQLNLNPKTGQLQFDKKAFLLRCTNTIWIDVTNVPQ